MLTESIFDWAKKTPVKIALNHNGETWSYAAFAEAIAVARGSFHRRGMTGEGVAVLAIGHLRDFWVANLALRSLGLTTIAIRSAEALGGLRLPNARLVVANGAEAWPGLAERCAERGLPLASAALGDGAPLGLEATAYLPGGHILQTSGTTGDYKLVLMAPAFEAEMLRRRRAVNGVSQDSLVNVFEFAGWTGVGYKSPATTWAVGGGVIFHQGLEPHLALAHPAITHSTVIPGMLAAILAQPEGSFPRSPTMQLMVTGGTITQDQIDQAKARITPHLYNSLSATESHHMAFTSLDTPDDHRWHRPQAGSLVEIVDEFDRPVPVGRIGRLRVGTEGGPTGYLNDEAATRTFFKDGFFYPGDLAVRREDGRIALQGRVTDVINVKGHKLAPAPIEDRLREALGVSGVCLVSMQDETGEEELHLAIETPAPIDTEALTAAIRQELSGFAGVRVHFLASLPRNAMGKVLRSSITTQLIATRQPR